MSLPPSSHPWLWCHSSTNTWVCQAPITLQGWHSYLSDRLSCSKPACKCTFQDPGNWRRVEGEVHRRWSSLGRPPQQEADKNPPRTGPRYFEGLDSPLSVLCQTSLFASPFLCESFPFRGNKSSYVRQINVRENCQDQLWWRQQQQRWFWRWQYLWRWQ